MSRLMERYGAKDWHALVVAKIGELRQGMAEDRERFEALYSCLDDAKSARDGEKLERAGRQLATLSYKDDGVLSFSVAAGNILVQEPHGESRHFDGVDDAIEFMATLMAAAVERDRSGG